METSGADSQRSNYRLLPGAGDPQRQKPPSPPQDYLPGAFLEGLCSAGTPLAGASQPLLQAPASPVMEPNTPLCPPTERPAADTKKHFVPHLYHILTCWLVPTFASVLGCFRAGDAAAAAAGENADACWINSWGSAVR